MAQYHCNENAGNRHRLNQSIIDQLTVGATPTANHRILARLPISTYWTTNYDQLIESALRDAGKIPEVKYTTEQLATTKARRDAVVYKMHGDVEHAHDAVLIKDDYEKYHIKRGAFINALAGDLVSKTFLFIGFSFTDPNLDYVLSRVRVTFRENQRRHHCIFKTRTPQDGESDAEFENAQIKQRLVIDDLKRFNIKTLLIDEFAQITEILARIERQYRQKTIFISGSAEEYGAWTKQETEEFLRDLSRALVQQGYRVATGVGMGVGDAIITGAIEEVYRARTGHIEDSLIMRPFPRANPDEAVRQRLWEEYRQELISAAGICLVVLGNKRVDGLIVPAGGVRREYEIARQQAAQRVFDLYKRHAGEVNAASDEMVRRHATAIRERTMPDDALLRTVHESASVISVPAVSSKEKLPDNFFRKRGGGWEARFNRANRINIIDVDKGAEYINLLLAHPGREASFYEVACGYALGVANQASSGLEHDDIKEGFQVTTGAPLGDAGVVVDRKVVEQYRAKYQSLVTEKSEAEQDGDHQRAEEIEEELAQIADALTAGVGKGGKLRKAGDKRKNVRDAFRNAVDRAIKKIAQYDKPLAEHLKASIKHGNEVVYRPPTSIVWDVRPIVNE